MLTVTKNLNVKTYLMERIDAWTPLCRDIAKQIWEHPELAYEEYFASKLQSKTLQDQGFHVKQIPGIETAFMAEFGSGSPIIGIAGEYDALPGQAQDPVPYKSAADPMQNGHACGHNLIGAGGILAALAVKDAIASGQLNGRIRYYGCPAEEGGGGKVRMIEAGVFDDLDCALHWHPECTNKIIKNIFLAKCNLIVTYEGLASISTVRGSMAGDTSQAADLANIGVQYLRKYFDKSMVEGHFIRAGAVTHNVLPRKTEILYGLRADNKELLDLLVHRVMEVAEGAAKMTGTTVVCRVESPYDSELYLESLGNLIYQNMTEIPRPLYSPEDLSFADQLAKTINPKFYNNMRDLYKIEDKNLSGCMHIDVIKSDITGHRPSSDFCNITRVVPGAMFFAAAVPMGFPMHCWQATSCTGTSIGMQAMEYAAKVLSATICDLAEQPDYLKAVKEEFNNRKEKTT